MAVREGTPHFKLVLRERDIWLGHGQYLIGRGSACHVLVDDVRVSRRHALLTIRPGSATISDFGSANGVYVDGVRVGAVPEPLLPGCRIVIGNEVLQIGVGAPPQGRESIDTLTGEEEPVVPSSYGEEELPTVRTLSSMLPPAPPSATGPAISPSHRVDAVKLFAPIAMAAIHGGRAADAEQLLGVHLRTVLARAKSGALPDAETLARAVDLALELALTGRAGWLDFVIDLLDTLRVPPVSREAMDRLERAARGARNVDVDKITRWARTLRRRAATLGVQEVERLDRLEGLVASLRGSG